MGLRRVYILRLLCLTAVSGIVIVGLHFYLYIYKKSPKEIDMFSEIITSQSSERLPFIRNAAGDDKSGNAKGHLVTFHRPPIRDKLVHLDLKGMPFRITAFRELFPFLRNLGVTGLLVEYEDMFPYHGQLQPIANLQSYNESEIREFLDLAQINQLEVIPLIQTFGHLEFVLKLQPFLDLREVPRYPQVICPTNNKSQELIKEMIRQIMEIHKGIKYMHIGSDEVYHIGQCPLCRNRMIKSKTHMDEGDLFLLHVKSIAQFVRDTFHIQPMMWDDEFRKLDESVIQESGIGELVDIVVWNYRPDVDKILERSMWQKYSRLFKSIWIGSAFKGADKPNSIIVNETFYLSNHISWGNVLEDVKNLVSLKGVVLTGWQRYDHFSSLCEILPSAVPSLVSCMIYLNATRYFNMEAIFSNASSYLDCNGRLNFCRFPGSEIHQSIIQLQMLKDSFKSLQNINVYLGWATELNLKYGFSNPAHVEPIAQEVNVLHMELDRLQVQLQKSLSKLYPEWSVQEWMVTNFDAFFKTIVSLKTYLDNILDKSVFLVRPLPLETKS